MYLSPALSHVEEVLSGLLGALGKNCVIIIYFKQFCVLSRVSARGLAAPVHAHLCHLLFRTGGFHCQ